MARSKNKPIPVSSDEVKVTRRGCFTRSQLALGALFLCGGLWLIGKLNPKTPPTALPTVAALAEPLETVMPTSTAPLSPTPEPTIDGTAAAAFAMLTEVFAQQTATAQAQVTTAGVFGTTIDNGQVAWDIERVMTQNTAAEWNPLKGMTYLAVIGTIHNHSDQSASLKASQVRLLIDGQEYVPLNGLMDRLKSDLNGMDFFGAYSGLTVAAGESKQAFVAFEIPLVRDSVSIRLDTQILALNSTSGIEIALGATLTPDTSRTAIALTGGAVYQAMQVTLTHEAKIADATATVETLKRTVEAIEDAQTQTFAEATYNAVMLSLDQTATARPTATITNTPAPLPTSAPATVVLNQRNETRMIQSTANIRPCPHTTNDCERIAQLAPGSRITIIGDVQGDTVSGSTLWYVGTYEGKTVYVHSSLVAAPGVTSLPTAVPVASSNQNTIIVIPGQSPASVPQSQGPVGAYTCDCSKTCQQISTCEEAYYQLNTCGCKQRDSDNPPDGIPCENLCGG